jgi:peptide deformylase
MALRTIVTYPDPRLRAVATPVTVFDDALRTLAADLIETMRAAGGIGITAPHIGIAMRLVVLELTTAESPRIYVNPRIVWASDERARHPEGSVSMSGVGADV